MRTRTVKASDVRPEWYVVDATGQTLGRLASHVAQILRGKGKPLYAPYIDNGDFVVVVNAGRVAITGTNKMSTKFYYRHSGYAGGLRSVSLAEMMAKHPERVLEHAIRGMLPRGPLGRHMYNKLKVYAGPEHPHQAQQPKEIELK
ncbi:MAG: 50S ribosomal protein L13 [Chloroflexi bacterium]|nr:50S ribosomal protein L13 [Chloroflexota bacterium]MCL5109911.1 50S ribosomal protein L13 [Chloroflexota bacterium]